MSNTKLADSTIIRNQAKLIKEQEAKIVDLEAKLKTAEANSSMWYKEFNEMKDIVDGIHEVLDDLGVRGYKDDNKYYRLPLTVRLFAWALKK